jgi:hypothetical protein
VKVKQTFLKYTALLLSISILVGTIGISANFHICQGKVKTFSFFSQAEQCSPMELVSPCKKSTDKGVNKKKCCNNETIYGTASFETNIDLNSDYQTTKINTQYPNSSSNKVAAVSKQNRWGIHTPPFIRQQGSLIIAYQNFLI